MVRAWRGGGKGEAASGRPDVGGGSCLGRPVPFVDRGIFSGLFIEGIESWSHHSVYGLNPLLCCLQGNLSGTL